MKRIPMYVYQYLWIVILCLGLIGVSILSFGYSDSEYEERGITELETYNEFINAQMGIENEN